MASIRTQNEIDQIINRAQHTIATLGLEIVNEEKQGITNTTSSHRDKVYRLLLLRIYLQNLLDEYGVIYAYHTANQLRLNQMLDAVVKLSKVLDGPAIPFLGTINLPLYYYPSSAGFNNGSGGGGQATPGGTTFSNSNVDAPGELVDAWNASDSTFAFYIYNVIGSNPGEGSRSGFLVFTIRGSDITMSDAGNTSVGGSTTGVSFSAAIDSGVFELTCNVPSDNWIVKGTRILFSNISFQNVQGPLPAGGTTGQFLVKSSNLDYEVDWLTLLWQHITDVTPTLTEINRVSGVTSPIQTQLNTLTALLNNYLLLSGGTMSGDIVMSAHRVTGLAAAIANGQALRYEQVIGLYLLLSGGTMSGILNMGGNKITNLPLGTDPTDAARVGQIPAALGYTPVNKAGDSMTGILTMFAVIVMSGNTINGLASPSFSDQAATKGYVDALVPNGYRVVQSPDGLVRYRTNLTTTWNMQSTTNITIGHSGVQSDITKFRIIDAFIIDNAGTSRYQISMGISTSTECYVDHLDSSFIYLTRRPAGQFANASFSSATIYIEVDYTP